MILNVYKEKNWTSFDVVAKLRGLLKTRKIGHAGTLDPLAEGVLLILTDSDTKRQDELMKLQKEYRAEIAFGATSKTYDLEGELEYSDMKIPEAELKEKLSQILPKFIGTYEQEVPHYSAVKVGGRPLYKSARANQTATNLPKKEVTVYDIKIENIWKNSQLNLSTATFLITCAKGFYVRSFANALGKELGTGAVLTKLTRTRVGDYSVEDSKPISSFSTVAR